MLANSSSSSSAPSAAKLLTQPEVTITNGRIQMDGALLVGGSHTTPWWNGKLKTNYLKKASPAITRFVPGREGLGLTDRIDSVVDFMKQKNILVFDQNYGLWYDRRRDDHERFAVGMVMYGDLSMNSHSVVAVREQHGKD